MGDFVGEVAGLSRLVDYDLSVKPARAGDRTFDSQEAALQHIESLPPSDTDYAVVATRDGRFQVRELEADFDPAEADRARLTTRDVASHETAAVAIVFRDKTHTADGSWLTGSAGSRSLSRVVTAEGAGPIRERQHESHWSRGIRAAGNQGSIEGGGTYGSQRAQPGE